ncbi:Gfo/Idh/MocA family protein [Luteolibacter marinus]|uniref:Gfo/Idh/MocA family protein n=1 Tax=Luteolibacter marinus TaxID=2776705 RepID=UPI001867771E|nr:Gfo/Idh/MocA family oxidoreductase [Luteolibacter marinus]
MQRRPFLATLGATAAALTTGTRAQEAPGRKLGWALVGLGSLSTHQIAPALAKTKHCRLAAIVTGTPEKAEKWKAQYGIPDSHVYNYETFDRIAENPDVDVIYVVLPNSMHEEFVIRGAKAGKHVFCEKPMANSADECRRMIAAMKSAGKQLGVGYRCQFEPHHRECMRLAREKVFGDLKFIEAGFGFQIGDPAQWRLRKKLAGGGALMDVGIYALQACRYLTGEEPVEIVAQEVKTDPVKFAEVDETISWSMKFPSGVMASVMTTYAFNGVNSFTAVCQNGKFGMDPAYSYDGLKGWTSKPEVKIEFPAVDHFQTEMDAFAAAILADVAFVPSGEEGLWDLLAIEAIYRSIAEGKAVTVGNV